MKGRISSLQSLGAADGPGVRYLVFMQGCLLRCIYCHNPETWQASGGFEMTAEEIFHKIRRCIPYFGDSGGVTVSGGEPLLQSKFVADLFSLCRRSNIHTAIDTSGIGANEYTEELLNLTDLVICDVKFISDELYRKYCSGSLSEVFKFLSLTEKLSVPLWIRHVVVPGITDSEEEISEIIRLVSPYSNLRKIELLPFSKLCTAKYDTLCIPFPLSAVPECDNNTIQRLKAMIPKYLQ